MTKQAYLSELNTQLKAHHVEDSEEILQEYGEHFDRKLADGYTEEEIAAKLASPKELAGQFAQVSMKSTDKKQGKLLVGIGLAFIDIVVISFVPALISCVIALGSTALSFVISGIAIILEPLLPSGVVQVPPMPYYGGVFIALSLLALGVLTSVGTVYSWALSLQLGKAYMRWHKNMLSDAKYPPLPKFPGFKNKTRRILRSAALMSLVVFGVSLVVGYVILALSAGSLGFWHVWHWFQ